MTRSSSTSTVWPLTPAMSPQGKRKKLARRASATDGTWQLPYGDASSTWTLKPDGPHPMAANEATRLRLAAACALEAAETGLHDGAGLPVLAVRRYDRLESPGGALPARMHQEDGCQATATPSGTTYEEQGDPALRDLVGLLRNYGDPADVTRLLRRTALNMAVGNADAHAKNFSILHDADSTAISIAPLYDVLSAIALELTDCAIAQVFGTRGASHAFPGRKSIAAASRTSLASGVLAHFLALVVSCLEEGTHDEE